MVSWKVALERRTLPPIDKEVRRRITIFSLMFIKMSLHCKTAEKIGSFYLNLLLTSLFFWLQAFQAQSGFIDVDRIDSSAWPSIICDLYSGESSIIASAFGNIGLFLQLNGWNT